MEIQNIGLQITAIDLNEKSIKSQAKCIKDRISTLACNNPNCTVYAFVCDDKYCQCRKIHKKCLFTDIDQIIQLIEDKKQESADVIHKVSSVLENWIDEISKTRQKIQNVLRDWGLSPIQKTFINLMKTRKYNELTGNHINQITTKTILYFTEQTKEKMMQQIDTVAKNYDSQIKSIMKTISSLFERFEIDEKQTGFKDLDEVQFELQQDLLTKVFKNLQEYKKPYQKQDYEKFVIFFKQALKVDFSIYMKKYKKSRRVYGTRKLRQKYFEEYFMALNKGEKYIRQWEDSNKSQLNQLSKFIQSQLISFCDFYRQSDGAIEKPFKIQMALSLQKTINIIYLLVDFIKYNGKQMMRKLFDRNKRLTEKFEIIMYFLDGLMDEHPQIDQVETVWNVIRFENKLKSEVNYLYDIIQETLKDPYEIEIKSVKNQQTV